MEHEELTQLTAAYALDALSEDEAAEFEGHLRYCEHCRAELASFHDTASALAYAAPSAAPQPELRERILAQAREDRPKVVPLRSRRRALVPAAIAAAVAVGIGIWAVTLTRSLSDERVARNRLESKVALLADPAAKRVPVTGADGVLVYAPTGQAALVLAGLEPAPAGRTYEAWVNVNGAMRPAGTFAARGDTTVFVLARALPSGAGVAVTIEPAGGADQPSGAPIFTAKTA